MYFRKHSGGKKKSGPGPSVPASSTQSRQDYEDAVRRNLHVWADWRKDVNDELILDLFNGKPRTVVPPLEKVIKQKSSFDYPDPDKFVSDPASLIAFGIGHSKMTDLGTNEFLQYGIPRARLNSSQKGSRAQSRDPAQARKEMMSYEGHDVYYSRGQYGAVPSHQKHIQHRGKQAQKRLPRTKLA